MRDKIKEMTLEEILDYCKDISSKNSLRRSEQNSIVFKIKASLNEFLYDENLFILFEILLKQFSFSFDNTLKLQDLAIKAYTQSDFIWRGRNIAIEEKKSLDNEKKSRLAFFRNKRYARLYGQLGDYFSNLSDYRTALVCYQAAEKSYGRPNTEYYCNQLRCELTLDDNYQCPYSKKQLKKRYHRYYDSLEHLLENGITVKIDPVTHSKEFQDAYDAVNEETYQRMKEEGMNIHIPQLLWMVMEECYLKRGITWKSPRRMNPRIYFD